MYRTVTEIGEVRQHLSGAPVIAFDFERAFEQRVVTVSPEFRLYILIIGHNACHRMQDPN